MSGVAARDWTFPNFFAILFIQSEQSRFASTGCADDFVAID
jgi:hypothetical protein